MRLDKFISENTHYSRSEVKQLVKQRRVTLEDKIALSPSQQIGAASQVKIDDEQVFQVGLLYLMMHKPAGYLCSNSDREHPTVIDLTSERHRFEGSDEDYSRVRAAKLQIVGRLDLDTTGLLLLSNDGSWNHKITSPNSHCDKTYKAELERAPTEADVAHFAKGLQLRNEAKLTKPASLERVSANTARVILSEGRYHQVKRMFAACGNRVLKLHREQIGKYNLPHTLLPGKFCLISP